jgi:hypothetical protein
MPRSVAALLGLFSACLLAVAPPAAGDDRLDELQAQVGRLRAQVVAVDGMVRAREQGLGEMQGQIRQMSEDVAQLKAPAPLPMAGPFLAGAPPSSDSAGVSKVAVFAPKVEVDSTRRHDTVFLKLRRIEADGVKLVGETELGQDTTGIDLPLDRSGALFVVEWSTTEGHSYNLLLKDGATGQTAASVQVKPLQSQGRLIFVGYRLE